MNKIIYSIVLVVTIASCSPTIKTKILQKPTNVDFTRYVAIGNSLTSGYQDGALSREGQVNCFPKMIFDKMNELYGGSLTFKIPYLPANTSNNGYGNPRFILGYKTDCTNVISLSPIPDMSNATVMDNVSAGGPYNLCGAPGLRAVEANFGLVSGINPFLQRFCSTPGVSTILSEALRNNPTFFTLWLGNNDVLLYATGGATGAVAPATPMPGDLSSVAMLAGNLTVVVDSLTKRGAKGVIANIPDVSSVPYFTTIPWNGAVIDQATADLLNVQFAGTGITWKAGANPFIIEDATSPIGRRQATPNDFILLNTSSDSIKCGMWGIVKPLKDQNVLDKDEAAVVKAYTDNYNAAIKSIASSYNLALVDMNTYMKTFVSGITYNGIGMNAKFVSGGAFSLDGVHPNSRGYALIANEFIKAINAKYGTNMNMVDVTNYKGVVFPK